MGDLVLTWSQLGQKVVLAEDAQMTSSYVFDGAAPGIVSALEQISGGVDYPASAMVVWSSCCNIFRPNSTPAWP